MRFTVHVDCYPLPESIFKKAIKDNYDNSNKFKTELTIEQVRNPSFPCKFLQSLFHHSFVLIETLFSMQVKELTKLFRPAEIDSKAPPVRSPPRARAKAREHDREVYKGERESSPHSRSRPSFRDRNTSGDARSYAKLSHERHQPIARREAAGSDRFPRDAFMGEKEYRKYGLQGASTRGDARSYPLLSHEMHQPLTYKEVAASPRAEEFPPDSFMSEKEYRTYGLRRASRNMSPPAHDREHLLRHQAPPVYVDVARGQEHVGRDPLFVNEQEYRAQGLHARQELPSSVFPATANPADALVERGYLIQNPASMHREPLHRHATSFINGGEYLTSHLSARHESPSSIPAAGTVITASAYPRDPYYTSSGVSVDTYPRRPPPRREEARTGSYVLSGRAEPYLGDTNQVRMREADTLERIYATYAASDDAPSKYDQMHRYQEAKPEARRVPVSSLYSFAGPSSLRP